MLALGHAGDGWSCVMISRVPIAKIQTLHLNRARMEEGILKQLDMATAPPNYIIIRDTFLYS